MRIGIFTESFLPQVNGVVTAVCASAKELSKKHEVRIFTVGSGPDEAIGCIVKRFKGMKLPTYKDYCFFVPCRSVWKKMSNERLDVVHVRSSVGFGLIALSFARKRRIPLIGTLDTPISDYVHYVPFLGRFECARSVLSSTALKYMVWFYNRCDCVIVPSNVTKNWLIEIGCKSNIIVLSNGVDNKRFKPTKRSKALRKELLGNNNPNEPILLHVGRITKEKSVSTLIKAANKLKEDGIKFKLIIVGKGPALASLKRMSKLLNVDDCVHFAGFVPDEKLAKYYASSDMFVTASTVETEGIVMLEAMASGIPVIGPDAGAAPEVISDGKNGIVFVPEDHYDLSRSIKKLIEPEYRKQMAINALESSKEYSIEKTSARLEQIYSILSDKNSK